MMILLTTTGPRDKIFREDKDMKNKTNPVKKNMDKLHKPSTHIDKSKYDRKSESEILQDELEPIWYSTEHDESDDLEDAKRMEDEGGMDYSGAFESDIKET